MGTKGKRPLRSLTPGDKITAIQRIHDGESKASVARDIGVPESTLRGWCKNEDKLRFLSRQTGAGLGDNLSDFLGGPAEKRPKLNSSSLPIAFANGATNKIQFDDLGLSYKDLQTASANLGHHHLDFKGLSGDYGGPFSAAAMKTKMFGADISRPIVDPSIAAISPLSSLSSQLSGLSSLSQSPLAMSFNELTANLNLLAQLNPGLAAMSGLNGLNSAAAVNSAASSALRTVRPTKVQKTRVSPTHSTRGETSSGTSAGGERLFVKNWAKVKRPLSSTETPDSCYDDSGRSSNIGSKRPSMMKCPSPAQAPNITASLPTSMSSGFGDDPLLYWLKSQQALLGLSSMYPATATIPENARSPPIRSSTPQHHTQHQSHTPPITPSTSTTPAASLDEKSSAWLNWCKAFGASLSSLAPPTGATPTVHACPMTANGSVEGSNTASQLQAAAHLEKILYSQLTKDSNGGTKLQSLPSSPTINPERSHRNSSPQRETQERPLEVDPEDLSVKPAKTAPLNLIHGDNDDACNHHEQKHTDFKVNQHISPSKTAHARSASQGALEKSCKDILDNLINNISKTACLPHDSETDDVHNNIFESRRGLEHNSDNSSDPETYVDASYNETTQSHINNHNNNNNSNKTDEEEKQRLGAHEKTEEDGTKNNSDLVGLQYGEKFLHWLENVKNARVSLEQLEQLRSLIATIKAPNEDEENDEDDDEDDFEMQSCLGVLPAGEDDQESSVTAADIHSVAQSLGAQDDDRIDDPVDDNHATKIEDDSNDRDEKLSNVSRQDLMND